MRKYVFLAIGAFLYFNIGAFAEICTWIRVDHIICVTAGLETTCWVDGWHLENYCHSGGGDEDPIGGGDPPPPPTVCDFTGVKTNNEAFFMMTHDETKSRINHFSGRYGNKMMITFSLDLPEGVVVDEIVAEYVDHRGKIAVVRGDYRAYNHTAVIKIQTEGAAISDKSYPINVHAKLSCRSDKFELLAYACRVELKHAGIHLENIGIYKEPDYRDLSMPVASSCFVGGGSILMMEGRNFEVQVTGGISVSAGLELQVKKAFIVQQQVQMNIPSNYMYKKTAQAAAQKGHALAYEYLWDATQHAHRWVDIDGTWERDKIDLIPCGSGSN